MANGSQDITAGGTEEVVASVLHGIKDLRIVSSTCRTCNESLILFRNVDSWEHQQRKKYKWRSKPLVSAARISTTSTITGMGTSSCKSL